jgi:hypothetical protein
VGFAAARACRINKAHTFGAEKDRCEQCATSAEFFFRYWFRVKAFAALAVEAGAAFSNG